MTLTMRDRLDAMFAPDIWVRPKHFAGVDGWEVHGRDNLTLGLRLWVPTREVAEALVQGLRDENPDGLCVEWTEQESE